MTQAGTATVDSKAGEYHPGLWLDAGARTAPQALQEIIDAFPPNTVLARQTADTLDPNLYAFQFPPTLHPSPPIASVQNAIVSFNEPRTILSFPVGSAYSYFVNFPPVGNLGIVTAPQLGPYRIPVAGITPMTAESNFYNFSVQRSPAILGSNDDINTTVPINEPFVEALFASTFRAAADERFEDGMDSAFSRNLESVVRKYDSRTAEETLAKLLVDPEMPVGVWAEAMRWLGRADKFLSRESRLWLLEKGLISPSSAIRDGAILGLSSIGDSSAIPYLERAVDTEKIRDLRADMEQVLAQLKKL
jgi:hypothetical protein